jgi:prolyl oligopeptidase
MKWTSKRHLALWGTSAGGIMVGRAITERPDLFRVAIGEVGAFNTLRFELTANGPGNDLEFGTVKKQDEFGWLREMDAFHHVQPGVKYPAALFITGANDARVEPWQIAKMAARMQKCSTSGRPVLLRVDYASGHFASTRAAALLKYADIFAFMLGHVG